MNKLEEYISRYRNLHSGVDPYISNNRPLYDNTSGKRVFDGSQLGKKLPPYLKKVIRYKNRAVTLLDYGCGKALHVHTPLKEHNNKTLLGRLEGMVQCYYCYDPAVDIYSVKPPRGMVFDIVCCADVMEHIPEEYIQDVFNEIASYTKEDGTAIFTISGNPAKKTFEDGENLHATIKPLEWWLEHAKNAFGDKSYLIFYNDESEPDSQVKLRYHNSSQFNAWNFENRIPVLGTLPCQSEEVA